MECKQVIIQKESESGSGHREINGRVTFIKNFDYFLLFLLSFMYNHVSFEQEVPTWTYVKYQEKTCMKEHFIRKYVSFSACTNK